MFYKRLSIPDYYKHSERCIIDHCTLSRVKSKFLFTIDGMEFYKTKGGHYFIFKIEEVVKATSYTLIDEVTCLQYADKVAFVERTKSVNTYLDYQTINLIDRVSERTGRSIVDIVHQCLDCFKDKYRYKTDLHKKNFSIDERGEFRGFKYQIKMNDSDKEVIKECFPSGLLKGANYAVKTVLMNEEDF